MKFIDSSGVQFECDVEFNGDVSFAVTPPEISLDNLNDLTAAGTITGADLVSTDDVIVGDDLTVTGLATVGETLAVTGAVTLSSTLAVTGAITATTHYSSTNGNITLTNGNITLTNGDLAVGDDATITGDLTVSGAVDLSGADSITLPSTHYVARRYVSQAITTTALSAGATCTVALTGEPTTMIPLACYVVTSVATTSSSVNTTGLTVEIGISGDDNFYMESTSVFGAAGRKEAYAGVGMGGYRAADSIVAKFSAVGGGSEDCGDIDALSMYVVIYYLTVAAES